MRLLSFIVFLPLVLSIPQHSAHHHAQTSPNGSPLLATEIGPDCINKIDPFASPAARLRAPQPRGKNTTIAGVNTYIVQPPSKSPITIAPRGETKVVLFLSDVYSAFNVNNQLVQDAFADAGFHTLGLDYFHGDPIDRIPRSNEELMAWLEKARAQADEDVPKWVKAVKEIYGPEAKYSTVGYCFGAPYAMDLGASDEVVATAFAHPAFLTEDHFRKLTKPLLLSCAETDSTFSPEALYRAADLLAEEKKRYHLQIFSGTSHGFATRADEGDENGVWAKDESLRSIAAWFNRFSK